MKTRELNPKELAHTEDWEGNNIAVTCPQCEKVFIVSGFFHGGERACPNCGRSKGFVSGGKESGGKANVQWEL